MNLFMLIHFFFFLFFLFPSFSAYAQITDRSSKMPDPKQEPPKIGNFSLPSSQQPSALIGFGGNIIDQGEVKLFLFADEFVGRKKLVTDVIPRALYGINDRTSILFSFPFTPIMRDGHHTSSGLEDFSAQLEYAFFNKKTLSYTDQATVVANMTFPTGSVKKNPSTGFGSPSFFLGITYYRTAVNWIAFTSHGALITTSHHGTKIGNQFLYQFGFAKNLPSPKEWIYAWMLEVDGQYSEKNRIHRQIDPNSGGNVVYITPSLWISSKNLVIQVGISFPLIQNLFGKQRKIDYALTLDLAWSFY